MSIISANNHYAGFGPMTAKLFVDSTNYKKALKNTFPILDFKKPSLLEQPLDFDNDLDKEYEGNKKRKTRQSFLSEFFKLQHNLCQKALPKIDSLL